MASKCLINLNLTSWLVLLLCGFGAGCGSATKKSSEQAAALATQIDVCHGYSCKYRSKLVLGASEPRRFTSILATGHKSAEAERTAIAKAVSYFERRTFDATRIRDEPRSKLGAGVRGQMAALINRQTRTPFYFILPSQLLSHHTVGMNASRGILVDGRYPHSTAVIRDRQGVKWAVDSWYAPMGAAPDILLLSEWKPGGIT